MMKHAAYCGTRNIYDDMEVSAKSLVANSSVDCVHFIIEDDEFPRSLPDFIKCHNVSNQTYFKPDSPNMASKFTYMAMMRIALCHVLPDVDKVLSLDCDTVVLRNLDGVWDIPLDGCYLSASEEHHRTKDGLQYCNFGVVLYNLEALRDGKADECIDVLNKRKYTWVEQDVGNYLCQGRIKPMPPRFNSCWWTDKNAPKPTIKHYAGIKRHNWVNEPEVCYYRSLNWDDIMELRNG